LSIVRFFTRHAQSKAQPSASSHRAEWRFVGVWILGAVPCKLEGKQGAPVVLTLQIVEANDCADGQGRYSGYARQETGSTKGETFLRGTQFIGADGEVRFNTIYPGWYPGRTPHIHFKAFVGDRNVITGQLYFPDPITEHVYATNMPYRERKANRDTFNADDFIFVRQGGAETIVALKEKGGSYLAGLVIGIERNR
jgi:hypothetical protein